MDYVARVVKSLIVIELGCGRGFGVESLIRCCNPSLEERCLILPPLGFISLITYHVDNERVVVDLTC